MRLPRLGTAVLVVGLGGKGASRRGAPHCATGPRSPLDLGLNRGISWDALLQRGYCLATTGKAKVDHLIH